MTLFSLIHKLVLCSLLICFSIYLLGFSYKYKKKNRYGFNSTIATAFILIFLAYIIFFYDEILPYPLDAAVNIWMAIIFGIQFIYFLIIRVKFKEKGDKMNVEEQTYEEDGEIKLKMEYMRKAFHTVILLVIVCYFLIAPLVNDFVYEIYLIDVDLYYSLWQTNQYPLVPSETEPELIIFTWTFMFFICALLLLLIPDLFRIYNRKYSMFSGVYKRVIRMKEFYTVGPQIYLTIGCTFVFLLSIFGVVLPIVGLAGMLIAAFGDAAAAIIGRKYGAHKFNTILQTDEQKSWEGLIAGFLTSFLCAILLVFNPLVAIIGSLVFIIIDYLNPKIADNVLNPILCTFAMMIPYWILAII